MQERFVCLFLFYFFYLLYLLLSILKILRELQKIGLQQLVKLQIHSSKKKTIKQKLNIKARISYSYVVDGITYTNNVIRYGNNKSFTTSAEAKAFLQNFKEGDYTNVFYNPNKPKESCLIKS